jgi:hypothetical protein
VKEHISTNLIERYRRRQLEPDEMLALDKHLGTCADCRRQLRANLSLTPALHQLQANVLAVPDEVSEHPAENQLRAYLMERLDAVDRELLESHLEFCADCQLRTSKLGSSIQPITEPGVAPSPVINKKAPDKWFGKLSPYWPSLFLRPSALRFAGVMAILALLIWGLIWGLTRWRSNSRTKQEIVETSPSPAPTTKDGQKQPFQPTPDLLLALNDGGRQVRLDANGNLTGFESLPASTQQLIKDALSNGRIETPKTLDELKSTSNQLMGRPGADLGMGDFWNRKNYHAISR